MGPVWVAGFSAGRAATGVHDDVWARVITPNKATFRTPSLAMTSLDFHPDVVKLRLNAAAAGLDFDHIMVSSTHQHEVPILWDSGAQPTLRLDTTRITSTSSSKRCPALRGAKESQEVATMKVARTEAPEYIADTREPIVSSNLMASILSAQTKVSSQRSTELGHPEALGHAIPHRQTSPTTPVRNWKPIIPAQPRFTSAEIWAVS